MDKYSAADTIELLRGYQAFKEGIPFVDWETAIWRAGWEFSSEEETRRRRREDRRFERSLEV